MRRCVLVANPVPPDVVHDVEIDASNTRYTDFDPTTNEAGLQVGVSWFVSGVSAVYLKGYEIRLVETEVEYQGDFVETFASVEITVS